MEYSSITWGVYDGKTISFNVPDASSQAALETFAETLKDKSNARVISTRFNKPHPNGGIATNNPWPLRTDKCTFMLRNSTTNRIIRISIPAPKDTILTVVNGNRKATQAHGDGVAAAMNTLVSAPGTYSCFDSKFWSKNLQG